MPNWASIDLVATNAEEENFSFKKHFNSFNQIIPEPKCLRGTTSGSISMRFNEIFEEGKSFTQLMKKLEPDLITIDYRLELFKCYKAKIETGYSNWYDWRAEHWGVKWDMDVSNIEDDHISFNTPWSLPTEALKALFEKYPNVNFEGNFAEEAMFFAGRFDRDEFHFADRDSDEMYELYFEHFGGEDDYKYIKGVGYQLIEEE